MPFDRWLLAAGAVLMLTASAAMAQNQARVYAIWGNPDNGRRVYAAKGCGRCHAINGVGPTVGPDLGRPPARPQTITQIAGAMWNHAPEMRKLAQEKGVQWTAFRESELRDLIAYLYFLRMLDQPGDVRRGERLFDEKHCSTVYEDQGCAACHTARGTGGAGGPDLTTVGRRRDAAWLTAFVRNPSSVNPASEMPPYDTMSAEDLSALVAYLQTLK
ncbi:MAG: cytochrome c [Acidobacteria bacterium]|nr:cytochrome c [Acidobacteriota bacterium]